MLDVVSSPKCKKDHLIIPNGVRTLCGVPCFNTFINWNVKSKGTILNNICLCCLTRANDEDHKFKKEELF